MGSQKQSLASHSVEPAWPTDDIWYRSDADEALRIRHFWNSLSEDDRKALVRLEKESVLKKIKDQQRQSCSCSICGKKRTVIEEELEFLYDAYYEELENLAKQQSSGAYPLILSDLPSVDPHDPSSQFIEFSNSLRARDGALTLDDDFIQNKGRCFIEIMERLTASKLREIDREALLNNELDEDPSRGFSGQYPDRFRPPGSLDVDDFQNLDDEGDDEEGDYAEEVDEDEDDDEYSEDEERRIEEGRRMFTIFAAKMFEQRVMAAYREQMANERQNRLLFELQEEERLNREKEEQRLKKLERKREQKKLAKQQKTQERTLREKEKQQQEEQLRLEKQVRAEEERRRKEAEAAKKAAERAAKEELERQRRLAVLKKKEEAQRREQEAKEAKEAKRREREERERKLQAEKEDALRRKREAREQSASPSSASVPAPTAGSTPPVGSKSRPRTESQPSVASPARSPAQSKPRSQSQSQSQPHPQGAKPQSHPKQSSQPKSSSPTKLQQPSAASKPSTAGKVLPSVFSNAALTAHMADLALSPDCTSVDLQSAPSADALASEMSFGSSSSFQSPSDGFSECTSTTDPAPSLSSLPSSDSHAPLSPFDRQSTPRVLLSSPTRTEHTSSASPAPLSSLPFPGIATVANNGFFPDPVSVSKMHPQSLQMHFYAEPHAIPRPFNLIDTSMEPGVADQVLPGVYPPPYAPPAEYNGIPSTPQPAGLAVLPGPMSFGHLPLAGLSGAPGPLPYRPPPHILANPASLLAASLPQPLPASPSSFSPSSSALSARPFAHPSGVIPTTQPQQQHHPANATMGTHTSFESFRPAHDRSPFPFVSAFSAPLGSDPHALLPLGSRPGSSRFSSSLHATALPDPARGLGEYVGGPLAPVPGFAAVSPADHLGSAYEYPQAPAARSRHSLSRIPPEESAVGGLAFASPWPPLSSGLLPSATRTEASPVTSADLFGSWSGPVQLTAPALDPLSLSSPVSAREMPSSAVQSNAVGVIGQEAGLGFRKQSSASVLSDPGVYAGGLVSPVQNTASASLLFGGERKHSDGSIEGPRLRSLPGQPSHASHDPTTAARIIGLATGQHETQWLGSGVLGGEVYSPSETPRLSASGIGGASVAGHVLGSSLFSNS
ncbi:uncharacterized protein BJ171DRAFT_525912 [Polychytrium aggregatum]|uniref:uncharacterized protein n=1 Tax=Polychytrium aggregatum TaxID=110093 RepID=UPI0022FE50B1|nr:uncharacterized protein BJ171DRAFT_525912 [Polychytrium aggregatum]KAI9193508.1 hypothetical protein BJ171DRAFT_525912 [Polychytrium aggregatum]